MKKEEMFLKKLLESFNKTDAFFLQLTLVLAFFGLVFAFGTSTYESYRLTNNEWTIGFKQLIAFICGLFLLVVTWKIDYKIWFKLAWILGFAALLLMLILRFSELGVILGGSKRWIDIGFFQFQPAEFTKFAIVLLFARQLTKYQWNDKKNLIYIGFCLLLILLILKQPDLGTAGILIILFASLITIFEWPIWLISIAFITISYAVIFKISRTPYQIDRLKFWLNPFLEPLGRGYNLIQAKHALELGGITGVGLGNSIQKEGYLPVAHADFIFAVIGEEIGFVGLSIILILYLTWLLRGFYLVNKKKEKYAKILGTSILLLIGIQTIINICVAIGLFPVTGITLPFFSCGGTSLIITFVMCGILFNITEKTRF